MIVISYPYQVTERGCALIFPPYTKKFKSDHVTAHNDNEWVTSNDVNNGEYEMNLNDSR